MSLPPSHLCSLPTIQSQVTTLIIIIITMKLRNLTLLPLLLVLVAITCLFSSTTAADAVPAAPAAPAAPVKKVPAAAACTGTSGRKKLGENFTDFSVPMRAAATVGESLGFAALVVGVLAVAGVNTYFKVKNSPGGLPGYSQAIYMREQH